MNRFFRKFSSKILSLSFAALVVLLFSCNDHSKTVADEEIVEDKKEIDAKAEDIIQATLKDILDGGEGLPDSVKVRNPDLVQALYSSQNFQPLWTSAGKFKPEADSLTKLITTASYLGLFPADYYSGKILSLQQSLINDTARGLKKQFDAAQWAYVEILMTSGFVQIIRDLKTGRLLPDSLIARDSLFSRQFLSDQLQALRSGPLPDFVSHLEPSNADYQRLKAGLVDFLSGADFTPHTVIKSRDTTALRLELYKRLAEEDSSGIDSRSNLAPDSSALKKAIVAFQTRKKIKPDGKISAALISRLNDTDQEKFIRIAINLDRFKQSEVMPEQYIWVNLPSYYLVVRNNDSVVLKSRVVIGKPLTRTPLITSALSDMITYPKWTIPESIIKKDILPSLKKDPGYLAKKGFSLVSFDGNEVDPYSVDWKKYNTGIPYKVVQGSGDDNALGVLKFNFPNTHSVYLHDTNQRYLFSRSGRALSHGCVRVQDYTDLAAYILRNDSLYSSNATPVDSLQSWLKQKQKRYIAIRKPIPLFIRYYTCEGVNGKVVFYEDVYGEDKKIINSFFSNKTIL